MILVTFAVPFESAAFRRRSVSRSVRIVHTGVGGDAARVTVERSICAEIPERVIVSGFAGALISDLEVGVIVGDEGDGVNGVRGVRILSAREVLSTAVAKQSFRQRTGAEAVDMETDAIREVCAAAGVPMSVRRAISDGSEDDLGLEPELLEKLAANAMRSAPRLIVTLLTNSDRRQAFLRLVRNCRKAQIALADALEEELIVKVGRGRNVSHGGNG